MMKRWGDVLSGAGALVFSLLSCAGCPLCLPIYVGLLSLIGIEVANLHSLLLPATAVFSLLSLGFMAYQTHTHQGKWAPFKLAGGAVMGMLAAAFYEMDAVLYMSLAVFMGSLIWNKKKLVHKEHNCC